MKLVGVRAVSGAAILAAMFLSSCGRSAPAHETPPASARPNIIVIIADDLGYSDIGAFGSEIRTPHLDQLAREGRVLNNLHTTPLCATSRAELLTGSDHHLIGLGTTNDFAGYYNQPGYEGVLNERAVTVAQRLRDAGYHTYMAGKWHLSEDGPQAWGFERSFSLKPGANSGSNFAASAGGASSFIPYHEDGVEAAVPDDFFSSDYFVKKIVEYIDADRADRKPFFVYLSYQAVHWPIHAPDDYLELYRGAYDAGYDAIGEARLARQKALGLVPQDFVANPGEGLPMTRFGSPGVQLNLEWEQLTADQKRSEARIMEVFAGMVTNMDDNVGRLVAYLKRSGAYDNTVILFLSDNGADGVGGFPLLGPESQPDIDNRLENYGRPGSYIYRSSNWASVGSTPFRLFKAFTAEGGISVPAILRLPRTTPAPGVAPVLSTLRDVTPTLLELAGVDPGGAEYQGRPVAAIGGRSLLPAVLGEREQVYGEDEVIADEVNDIRYLRRGPWKLTRFTNYLVPPGNLLLNHQWQLFDMARDRGETTDLAAQHPEVVEELRAEWRAYVERVGVKQPVIPPLLPPIDD